VEGTAAYIYKLASASILLRLDLYLIENIFYRDVHV